jgi:hypothetical protein
MNSACPRRVSLIIAGALPPIPSPTICVVSGSVPVASGSFPPRQASSLASRLAHSHRPNRVHSSHPPGQPVLRTGRSRSVALHSALLRRSYGSIPHGSSPHRSGLAPPYASAFSGALARRFIAGERQKAPSSEGTAEHFRPADLSRPFGGCYELRRKLLKYRK